MGRHELACGEWELVEGPLPVSARSCNQSSCPTHLLRCNKIHPHHVSHSSPLRIGVIGIGPRGLSVVERVLENARDCYPDPLILHLVEPRRFGSGDVWRTDQSPILIMNIVASQITAFTDASVDMSGPLRPGPTLYDWAYMVARGMTAQKYPPDVVDEARRTGPETFSRRSFYGHYLEWAFGESLRRCPDHVKIYQHCCMATSVSDSNSGVQTVSLDTGEEIVVDELVLALGHGANRLLESEQARRSAATRAGGLYYPPANPADVDYTVIEPGWTVLIRGLGLCFFDCLSLLTSGRGGYFSRTQKGLRYIPSGDEPNIVCGSRRGVPLHGRADNEKGDQRYEPEFLTTTTIERMRARVGQDGALDFRHDCWPLIAKEVETVYYSRLIAAKRMEGDAEAFRADYSACAWCSESEICTRRRYEIRPDEDWQWSLIARPWSEQDCSTLGRWREFIRDYLMADVERAQQGNITSPVKAAVDVLRDIRNELRYLINDGGIEGSSYARDVVGWFNSLHAFLSLGPPWSRIEELASLMDAGIVHIAGPGFGVDIDDVRPAFVGSSSVPADTHRSGVLIEAMLPKMEIGRTENPLLSDLWQRGALTRFKIPSRSRDHYATGGVAVTKRPFHAVAADGSIHPRRYIFGVPTEGANWVTETGIRPNVNSITLGDADAIARAVLGLSESGRDNAWPGRATGGADGRSRRQQAGGGTDRSVSLCGEMI